MSLGAFSEALVDTHDRRNSQLRLSRRLRVHKASNRSSSPRPNLFVVLSRHAVSAGERAAKVGVVADRVGNPIGALRPCRGERVGLATSADAPGELSVSRRRNLVHGGPLRCVGVREPCPHCARTSPDAHSVRALLDDVLQFQARACERCVRDVAHGSWLCAPRPCGAHSYGR